MSPIRPALLDASRPARASACLTLLGLLLMPWTVTLPDSVLGAWWVLTTWLPMLATLVLAPGETVETLRWCRDRALGRIDASIPDLAHPRRLHLPRAGAGAVRVRLRRSQGVRNPQRRAA